MKTTKLKKKARCKWTTRQRVATEYFETEDAKLAVARLRRWINTDPEMRAALYENGYRPRMRRFPPAVTRVIRKFLY